MAHLSRDPGERANLAGQEHKRAAEDVTNCVPFIPYFLKGGNSGAVCMPSRAMLHTGRSLFHIQKEGQNIPPGHSLLGETLREAGYQTFGTGKWHNGTRAYARSFSSGAEIFFGGMDDHWNVPACDFDPDGAYDKNRPFIKNPQRNRECMLRMADHIRPGIHSTELFTGATLDFLRTRDQTKPFFAYVSLMAPHDPRTMPRHFLDLYDPSSLTLPSNFLPEHPIDTGALNVRDELLGKRPREPEDVRRHLAEYYAMITHLDDALGRLIEALETRGELDNTIIVFSGDNGVALGQHGLFGKQNLYDHSLRVPLIFAGPGIPEDAHRDDLVYLMDLCPTLCALGGAAVPESMEATDLTPALCVESAPVGRELLYLAYCDTIRGVTNGRHKLIEYFGGETQLFDLDRDPAESTNLAEDPDQQETLKNMRKQLRRLAADEDDLTHPLGQMFWKKREDLR